ncbi:hypothetical protein ACFWWS_22695 [Streptomyces sp. NPDC059083]|uniref:hypothetical protein n=1 Tax=unclassified Streptomyces TaxID=2593676 RepID=UPI0036C1B45A
MAGIKGSIVITDDWNGGTPRQLNTLASRFAAQVFAIVEISETVIPELGKKGRRHLREVAANISENLKGKEADSFKEGMRRFMEELGGVDSSTKKSLNIEMEPAAALALAHFVQTAARYAYAGSREDMTRRALLVSLISSFEVLFGRLARVVYEKNKAALNDSDYSFTLEQLAQFESIEGAREFLIERRLSALLRESVDGWEKWLVRACGGLSMTALPVDWPGIRESFARRNLIVHAESIVNQIYLDTVRGLDIPGEIPAKGKKLTVSSEYLKEGAERILALGVILTSEISRKLNRRSEGEVIEMLVEEAEECARRGFWGASAYISSHALTWPASRSQKIDIQTCNWLARKAIHGGDEIRSEVEAWDTSGLSSRLAHRKNLLLDPAAAVEGVEHLLADGELTAFELAHNPLYEGVLELIVKRKESDALPD